MGGGKAGEVSAKVWIASRLANTIDLRCRRMLADNQQYKSELARSDTCTLNRVLP